ncbi:hypothetical protein BaRGS_00036389, partial [Batillaria attramentaria]
MGTGKNYGSGSSYGGYSSYKTPAPSYNRSYSYDASKPKYTTPSSAASVVDKIKKFSSMEPRYGQTDYRYPSLDRSTAGKDRYSSLDRYSNRSGYTSDYGGGTPYSSWDRASSRSNKSYGGSRETSPVSTRSSRYDYSSSASPYSTYSSYKSGSDASPVPRPSYDRQSSSRGYDAPDYSGRRPSADRRPSVDRYTGGLLPPPSPRQTSSSRRRESLTDETDDSAPEAEKRETAVKYLVCRGTSPPPDPEAPKRENKAKERISVSRTRRIKVPEKPVEKKSSRRQTVIEKRPSHTDCAIQCNMDQPQSSRSPGMSRNSSRSTLKDGDSRRSYKEEPVSSPPAERSWRQAVSRRSNKPPSRSSSREDMLEERPTRRKRHSSRDLLDEADEKAPLTTENISLRDSIEKVRTAQFPNEDLRVKKVNHWRQQLPPTEAEPAGGIVPSDSYEYLSANEHLPPQRDGGHSRNSRHDSPEYSRDNSPSRRSRRHGGNRKHASRSASNDSLLDAADEDLSPDPRLPNKDFRKSDLNRANYYEQHESDVFEREPSPESGGGRVKRSGSSSDQAGFSRDESPNRRQHRLNRDNSPEFLRLFSRRHRNRKGRTSRQGSREDILDDRGGNSNRQSSSDYRKRPTQLGVENVYDEGKHGKMAPSVSQHSLASATSTGTLPDIVPDASPQSLCIVLLGPCAFSAEFTQAAGKYSAQDPQQGKQQQQYQGARSGYISRVQDIDKLLKEERHRPRSQNNIMDAPVPPTSHNPLKPSPVHSPPPTRPNSYAFEKAGGQGQRAGIRQSKSLGDKLIDIEDERVQPQKAPPPQGAPPSRASGGQRKKVQLSPTAQQMWSILQAKKGLVTISDFLTLCEKPPQRRLIQVAGADPEDSNFKCFNNADDMLEYLGVDVHKLEDCALQIYRYHSGAQAEFGTYLDLESALDEQAEELEGFGD